MPSFYTNLGIEKQATGENANSWGDITNTNFDIIDEAMSEIYAISFSATSQTISPRRTAPRTKRSVTRPTATQAPGLVP